MLLFVPGLTVVVVVAGVVPVSAPPLVAAGVVLACVIREAPAVLFGVMVLTEVLGVPRGGREEEVLRAQAASPPPLRERAAAVALELFPAPLVDTAAAAAAADEVVLPHQLTPAIPARRQIRRLLTHSRSPPEAHSRFPLVLRGVRL